MRGSSPRMTQHVWRGQSVTVDPASGAPRPNEVIAGLDPAIQQHSLTIIMDARVKPAHLLECVARPECHGGPGKCGTASQRGHCRARPAIQQHSLNIIMDARVKPAHDLACAGRPLNKVIAGLNRQSSSTR